MCTACTELSPSYTTVKDWDREFPIGRKSIEGYQEADGYGK